MYLEEKTLVKLKEEVGRVLTKDGRQLPYIHNVKEFTKTSFSRELFKKSLTKEDFQILFSNVVLYPSVTQFILERLEISSLKDFLEIGGLSNLYLTNHLQEDMDYTDISDLMDNLYSEDSVEELEIMLLEIENNILFREERFQLADFFLSILEKYHVTPWETDKQNLENSLEYIHKNFARIYNLLFNDDFSAEHRNHQYFRSVGAESIPIDFFRAREVCTVDIWKVEILFENMLRLPVLNFDFLKESLNKENIHDLEDILLAITLYLFSERAYKGDLDDATRALLSISQILDEEDLFPVFRIFPDWFTPQSSYSYWVDDFGSADFLKNLRLNNSTKEERALLFNKVLKSFISVIITRGGEPVFAEALRNIGYRDEELVEIIKLFVENKDMTRFSYFQEFFPQEPNSRATYPGPLVIRYIYALEASEYSVKDYTQNYHKIKERDLREKILKEFISSDALYLTWDMAADYDFLYKLATSSKTYYYYKTSEIFSRVRVSALRERAYQLFEDVTRKTGWSTNRNLYSDWGNCIPANDDFDAFHEHKELMLQYKGYIFMSKLATLPEIAEDLVPFMVNRVKNTKESWNVGSYLTPFIETLKNTELYTREEKLKWLIPLMKTSHTDLVVNSNFSFHPRRLEVRVAGVENCTVEELLKVERGC